MNPADDQKEPLMTTTLMLIDRQQGMCHPDGAAGRSGLADVVASRDVLSRAADALATALRAGWDVIHVRLGFTEAYGNRTNATSRFADHERAGRFRLGSFDTQWCDAVAPRPGETTVEKGSVSPFASTALLTRLAVRRCDRLVLAGVATHLAVESAAREAADRGFAVTSPPTPARPRTPCTATPSSRYCRASPRS